jgi:hypothetical protein
MARYLAPAGIDDFSRSNLAEDLRRGWHEEVVGYLAQAKDPRRNELASPLFYDQLGDESGVPDGDPQGIPWNGFPLRLDKWFADLGPREADEAAHRAAEVVLRSSSVFGLYRKEASGEYVPLEIPFRVQDEYCEWHVEREGSRVESISFTCEPPEYWEFLAGRDFDLVHRLYKELLREPEIEADELRWPHDVYARGQRASEMVLAYRAGEYNPRNVWNTEKGAVHLTHPANSLFAEIILASDGTIAWPVAPDAQGNVDEIELMCCAGRGGINRSSDPLILRGVFNFARRGNSVALANPIGLYMTPFALGGLLDPDENPVGPECLRFGRQSADGSRILRAEVAPPQGASFTLDRCTLDGYPLRFGGQIARRITMALFGVAKRIPGRRARRVRSCPQFCCLHPEHPQFRGTFPLGQVTSCDEVPARWWRAEAYDVPDVRIPAPAGPAFAAAEVAEERGAESVIVADEPAVKLAGRAFMARDAAYEIEAEDL